MKATKEAAGNADRHLKLIAETLESATLDSFGGRLKLDVSLVFLKSFIASCRIKLPSEKSETRLRHKHRKPG